MSCWGISYVDVYNTQAKLIVMRNYDLQSNHFTTLCIFYERRGLKNTKHVTVKELLTMFYMFLLINHWQLKFFGGVIIHLDGVLNLLNIMLILDNVTQYLVLFLKWLTNDLFLHLLVIANNWCFYEDAYQ